MASAIPPFSELIATAVTSAVHLEMRDAYTPDDPLFLDWKAGKAVPEPAYPQWYDVVRTNVARGIEFRRLRIVSEPLAAFIRFEYDITAGLNVAAGERVRWLSRRRASDLYLPGNDFWLFDDQLVRIHHFSGDGDILEDELSTEPALIALCRSAFDAAWERAVDHEVYQPI
jgi:hypothetical protein